MNRLAAEASPYLKQHAHNPVDWYPWGPEALARAKAEDRPLLVSIGYSACHWCHVMERECFEKPEIAAIMNGLFVCVKVDREERPDVDALYMDAVHAMGLRGGWPLNVFLMPDARPFYGGTYFPPRQWVSICQQIGEAFHSQRQALQDSADGFARSFNQTEREKYGLLPEEKPVSAAEIGQLYEQVATGFDRQRGGLQRAPKFPMPVVWQFVLRYFQFSNDTPALSALKTTLNGMATGGLYDQLGGGFARYSTDGEWFLPHFEKMLYDNAQLLSLYAQTWLVSREPLYRRVVEQTVGWLEDEMSSPEGGFYAALDADSEGEEGLFYTWTQAEITETLGQVWGPLVCSFFQVTEAGNQHDEASGQPTGRNILFPQKTIESFELENGLLGGQLAEKLAMLLKAREARIRPGLDDKILTGWNALMLSGLTDAYRAFGEEKYLQLALRNARFLDRHLRNGGDLFHSFQAGRAVIPAFLDDYAALANAYANLYQATFDEHWLEVAGQLADTAIRYFGNDDDVFFYYSDERHSDDLFARKKEWFDNVIPSANSQLAHALHTLGILLDRPDFQELSGKLFAAARPLLLQHPESLAHWASLAVLRAEPSVEIVISGPAALDFRRELEKRYWPGKVLAGATTRPGRLPLLEGRQPTEQTLIYVCRDRVCERPVTSVAEAWELMG